VLGGGDNLSEGIGSSLLAKGRIAVWLIILSATILCFFGKISGEQFHDLIKGIAQLWLGAEAVAKGAEVVRGS